MQLRRWQVSQQCPPRLHALLQCSATRLVDQLLFETLAKIEKLLIDPGQTFAPHDTGQYTDMHGTCISGVELIGQIGVVSVRIALPGTVFHET